MANNPRDFFGIEDADIDDIQITFDTHMYFSQNERQKRELQLRKLHEPVLNPPDLLDRCIPRSDRFAEVHRYYNDPAELKKRIDFITDEGMLLYNFNTYLRKKTPCCNYETLPIPYGLRRRVFTYFSSITSNSGPMKNIAEHLGEGFYVEKHTAVTIISHILADGDPFEDLE